MNSESIDLVKIWQQVPVDYYQKGTKKNIFQKIWHNQKINSCKRIIKNLEFSNCLDVGCASGYMISEVAKKYPKAKYFGVDVYKKAIDYAKKRYPKISFRVTKEDKLPFKANNFDLILFYETIEHVQNPQKVLKEIKRVLRKGGHLVLAMDSGNLMFRIIWFIWEKTTGKVWDGAHLHPFHHEELSELIGNAGFKIKKKIFTHLGMEVVFVLSKGN